jgi:hypothetical protein
VREDFEGIVETMYGLLIVGNGGTLLASCDDGKTFAAIESPMTGHLWSIGKTADGLLVGAERGAIYHVPCGELAKILAAAYAKDPVIPSLAARVTDGEPGAEMVLEDALRERELW